MMPVYIDYPLIKDFFDVPGHTAGEKSDDYENLKFEADRQIYRQIKDISIEVSATAFGGGVML